MTGEIPTNIPAAIEILTTPKNQSPHSYNGGIIENEIEGSVKKREIPIQRIEYKNVEKQRDIISYIQLINGNLLPKQTSVKTILDYTILNNCILPVEFDRAKDLITLGSLAEKPLKFTLQKHL